MTDRNTATSSRLSGQTLVDPNDNRDPAFETQFGAYMSNMRAATGAIDSRPILYDHYAQETSPSGSSAGMGAGSTAASFGSKPKQKKGLVALGSCFGSGK